MLTLFGLEWTMTTGIVLAILVAVLLSVPYLVKEIRDGKRELGPLRRLNHGRVVLGPLTPTGTGDNDAGRPGNPAPGHPDAQADPYDERAQREAPPIRS